MLLEYINLRNFRQYKGEQCIHFSTSSDKPVTVIIGKNTGGKTTLVQAFIWCLYGHTSFTDKSLLNQDILYSMYNRPIGCIEEVEISVKLIHRGIKYIISRGVRYELSGNHKIVSQEKFTIKYESDNGVLKNIEKEKLDETIMDILPEKLSDYFFFLGERIEKLDTRTNLSKTVKDFLGLTIIDNSKKHLESIIKKLDAGYDDSFGEKEIKYTDAINKNNSKIENNEALIKVEEDNYTEYQQLFDELEIELRKNPDSAPIKKKIDECNIKKQKYESRLDSSKNKIIDYFNQEAYIYFSMKMAKKAVSLINKLPESEKGLAYQSKNSLEEILNRGTCLCGTNLKDKNSESYNNFIKIFEMIAPKSIKAMCDQYKIDITKNNTKATNYPSNIRNQFTVMRNTEDDIEDIDAEIKKLESELEGRKDLSDLKEKRLNYLNKMEISARNKGGLEKENDILKANNSKYSNKRDSIMAKNEKNAKILLYKLYAAAVLENIKNDYDHREIDLHDKLNSLVKKYFDEMYHGNRNLTLNKNYRIELTNDVNGKNAKTDISPGLETVKNFAFVAGLVEMAKEKIDGDDEKISEAYPLVLDAPFSQVDEIHVPNICKLLSKVAEQTIVVVMQKDWSYAEDVMKEKVGYYYSLDKKTETYTIVTDYNKEDC